MSRSRQLLESNAAFALKEWVKKGKQEMTDQGHVQTGGTRDKITGDFDWPQGSDKATATVFTDEIGTILDQGIVAGNVPFSAPSGRGGTSKYIEGLMQSIEFREPGLSEGEYLGIAIAIGLKAIRVGHPTANKDAKLNWIEKGLEVNADQFIRALRLEDYLEAVVDDFLLEIGRLPNVTTTI